MNRDGFIQEAKACFGDAVQVSLLDREWANQQLMHAEQHAEVTHQLKTPGAYERLTQEDIEAYGEWAWCEDCPSCGEPLRQVFTWDIVHGEGHCSNCKKAGFRYYHRPRGAQSMPIRKFALVGF